MRRAIALVFLLVAAIGAAGARAAVTAEDLRDAEVFVEQGVTRPDRDRVRLQAAADELAGKGFPTKFVIVAKKPADADGLARMLRTDLGESTVSAVLVLGPRVLGVDAKVFDCEQRLAFDAEVDTLRRDDVQGTINVAGRLQEFAEAGALRDSECKEIAGPTKDSGFPVWAIVLLAAAGVAGVVAIVLIRRAVARGEARRASEHATGDGLPPDADAADETETR
jgi:hypothetical protein